MPNKENENLQEIESLKKKIEDILAKMHRGGITRKAVKECLESPEVGALQTRADDLRKQSDELSASIVPVEVFEARIRRFDRLHEDALADGKVEKAQSILQEKIDFLATREKQIQSIKSLNSEITAIGGNIRALLRPCFLNLWLTLNWNWPGN